MKKVDYYKIFFIIYIKIDETTYYQKNNNRETVLSRAKDYHENNKELLTDKVRNKYRELSEEEKI